MWTLMDPWHPTLVLNLSFLLLSGWVVSLAAMKNSVPVGAIMMMNAILFTAQAAMGVVMLKKVKSEKNCCHSVENPQDNHSHDCCMNMQISFRAVP